MYFYIQYPINDVLFNRNWSYIEDKTGQHLVSPQGDKYPAYKAAPEEGVSMLASHSKELLKELVRRLEPKYQRFNVHASPYKKLAWTLRSAETSELLLVKDFVQGQFEENWIDGFPEHVDGQEAYWSFDEIDRE